MKHKLIDIIKLLVISIIISNITIPVAYASASIIKQTISDRIVTYYVSNNEENEIAMNLVMAHMFPYVKIIYSDKMICTTKKNARKYYTEKVKEYNSLYQNSVVCYANNVATKSGFAITSIKYNKNKTISVIFKFCYYDTLKQSQYICNKMNEAIRSNISNLNTDYQKAYWAYHWIIDNVSPDKTENNYSAYSGLTTSGTVCKGYAVLYCALANKLGLNCRYIEGAVNHSKINNHAWNVIEVDEKWYCIDTTWGDNSDNYDKYFLKSINTFSSTEYGYHYSKTYGNYIEAGEVFADNDYDCSIKSDIHPLQPSVYNIEMDILKYNILNIGEGYTFMINNKDHVLIHFVSENPNIATVDNNGIITGIGKGVTMITAFNHDLNIEQKCKITVVPNSNRTAMTVKRTSLAQEN